MKSYRSLAGILLAGLLPSSVPAFNWAWDQLHDVCIINPSTQEKGYVDGETLNWVPDECCKCTQCNVYSLSGIFFESQTDLILPGKGPVVALERTYNSDDPASSLLGHGWTLNLGKNVLPLAGRDGKEYLVVRRAKGQEVKLLRDGSAYQFTTAMNYGFKAEVLGAGWRITEKDGSSAEYNADGKLAVLKDPEGLEAEFTYNGAGCLTKVTNANGNWMDFTLNANGKLASVTDNHGRTVEYAYDGDGNLTGVDLPGGGTRVYGYGAGNLLTRISNLRGQVVKEIVYDDTRRAIEVKEKGETFTFAYDAETRTGTKTDGHDRVWTVVNDVNGVNIEERDPLGFIVKRHPNNSASARGMDWEEDQRGFRTQFTFDARGNRTSRTDPLGNREQWSYDANNRVTSHTNPKGVVTGYQYDGQGRVTQVTEAQGTAEARTIEYGYTGGFRTSVERYGLTTAYAYDTLGNRILEVGPAGDSTRYAYDSLSRLQERKEPGGAQTSYFYDDRGNVVLEINPFGGVTQRTFDADDNPTREISPLGDTVHYAYDAWNNRTRMIRGADTTLYRYLTIGDRTLPSAERTPRGKWSYRKYDAGGRLTQWIRKVGDTSSVADSNDLVTGYTLDSAGNVTRVDMPGGLAKEARFDGNNRKFLEIMGADTTETVYDSTGRPKTVHMPNGNTVQYSYNRFGLPTQVSDGLGVLMTRTYRSDGQISSETMPGKGAVTLTYDAYGRMIKRKDASGLFTSTTYNSAGQVASQSDSLGRTTFFAYDTTGQPVYSVNPMGDTLRMSYTLAGQAWEVEDPEGNNLRTTYDSRGRLTRLTYPDSGYEEYAFDPDGRLKTRRNPGGVVDTFSYDDAGRLTGRRYSTGRSIAYEYYPSGLLKKVEDGGSTVQMEYDGQARKVLDKQRVGGVDYEVAYEHHTSQRTLTLTYPGGREVVRKLDLRGRLDSVKMGPKLLADYLYDETNLAQKTLGNGIEADLAYDAAGKPTGLAYSGGTGTLPDFSMGYDMAGTPTFTKRNHFLNRSEALGYDSLNRITLYERGTLAVDSSIPSPVKTQSWTLDKLGNWDGFDDNGSSQTRTHNGANEILTVNAGSVTHDAKGNMTAYQGGAFQWDEENRLTVANGASYAYDGLGRRISKTVSGNTVKYIYDGWKVIREIHPGGVVRDYVSGEYLDEHIAVLTGNGSVEDTAYFLHDTRYNVTALTDESGAVTSHYLLDPYGTFQYFSSSGTDGLWFTGDDAASPASSADGAPIFQGQRWDADAGAYYFKNRYYHPGAGRFMSRDPAGFRDGVNLYQAYFAAAGVDPLGLEEQKHNITAKSFINDITQLYDDAFQGSVFFLALNAWVAQKVFNVRENPETDAKDGVYRLYTSMDINIDCCSKNSVPNPPVDAAAGTENMFGFSLLSFETQGTLGAVKFEKVNEKEYDIFWNYAGTPNILFEIPMALANGWSFRSSTSIWHSVAARLSCVLEKSIIGNAKLGGSQFPSHRLWIDGQIVEEKPQGAFSGLLVPVKNGPLVK